MIRTLKLAVLAFVVAFAGVTFGIAQGVFLYKAYLHAGF